MSNRAFRRKLSKKHAHEASSEIKLKFTDYIVTGTANITFWDGNKGSIKMKPYHINTVEEEEIFSGINDAGFGCQSIDSIDIVIYANYGGFKIPLDREPLHLTVPDGCGKKGV